MKKRILKLFVVGGLFFGISLSFTSCSKEKTAEEKKTLPPGHTEMVEEFRQKSIEESEKVIVARVNGSDISMKDLIAMMNQLGPLYKKNPGERTPEIDEKIKNEALDLLIFRKLTLQEAKKRKLKVNPEAVDQEINQVKANFDSELSYKHFLERSGHTEKTFRKQIEEDELFEMITQREIIEKSKAGGQTAADAEIERGNAWKAELKKKAKIEILEIQDVIPVSALK